MNFLISLCCCSSVHLLESALEAGSAAVWWYLCTFALWLMSRKHMAERTTPALPGLRAERCSPAWDARIRRNETLPGGEGGLASRAEGGSWRLDGVPSSITNRLCGSGKPVPRTAGMSHCGCEPRFTVRAVSLGSGVTAEVQDTTWVVLFFSFSPLFFSFSFCFK